MSYQFDNTFDFENVRAFIEQANIVGIGSNIFLLEKPKQIEAKSYLCYNFREINGGTAVRQYQLDFRIVGVDALELIKIKNSLIYLLDFYDRDCTIDGVRALEMLNGGGLTYNEETEEYNCFLYFLAKI